MFHLTRFQFIAFLRSVFLLQVGVGILNLFTHSDDVAVSLIHTVSIAVLFASITTGILDLGVMAYYYLRFENKTSKREWRSFTSFYFRGVDWEEMQGRAVPVKEWQQSTEDLCVSIRQCVKSLLSHGIDIEAGVEADMKKGEFEAAMRRVDVATDELRREIYKEERKKDRAQNRQLKQFEEMERKAKAAMRISTVKSEATEASLVTQSELYFKKIKGQIVLVKHATPRRELYELLEQLQSLEWGSRSFRKVRYALEKGLKMEGIG